MPTKEQLDADKRREDATSIKGDMPTRNSYQAERDKWDENGNLIDKDEVRYEQRQRDVLLGKVAPEDLTEEDFPAKHWMEKMIPQATPDHPDSKKADPGPVDLSADSLAPKENPVIEPPHPDMSTAGTDQSK